jgi:hypothetical protein
MEWTQSTKVDAVDKFERGYRYTGRVYSVH